MDLITKARLTLANNNSFKDLAYEDIVEKCEDSITSAETGGMNRKEEEDGDEDEDDDIAGKEMNCSKGPDEADLERRLNEECMNLLLKLQSKMLSEDCNVNAVKEGERNGNALSDKRSSSAPNMIVNAEY